MQIQTILDLVPHCFQALPLLKAHVGGRIILIFGVQFSPENDHQCSLLTVGFFVCFSSEPSVLRVWPLAVWAGCAGCVCTRALSPSSVRLLVTPWTAACQAALSMGCPRQERWSGLLFPPPGLFLSQGSDLRLLHCRRILYLLSHLGRPRCGLSESGLWWGRAETMGVSLGVLLLSMQWHWQLVSPAPTSPT